MTSDVNELQKLVIDMRNALQANQIFHTPLALRKNGKEWDEYQADAINRTKDCLAKTGHSMFIS